jgi:hypothetical protein
MYMLLRPVVRFGLLIGSKFSKWLVSAELSGGLARPGGTLYRTFCAFGGEEEERGGGGVFSDPPP